MKMDRRNFLIGSILTLLIAGGLIAWGWKFMLGEQARDRQVQTACVSTGGTWVKGMCVDRVHPR
jgi:hypothetical protein